MTEQERKYYKKKYKEEKARKRILKGFEDLNKSTVEAMDHAREHSTSYSGSHLESWAHNFGGMR